MMNFETLPENIIVIIKKINGAQNGNEATDILIEAAENGEFEIKNGILFKSGEYIIQNLFSVYGSSYEKNLRLLNTFNLEIIPEHITTLIKNEDMFIITRIKGCKSGDLKEYWEAKNEVTEENKQSAYNDLKKLTEEGYTDDKILSSSRLWFVTPDDNKIVLPSFEALRKTTADEKESVLHIYEKIIFG